MTLAHLLTHYALAPRNELPPYDTSHIHQALETAGVNPHEYCYLGITQIKNLTQAPLVLRKREEAFFWVVGKDLIPFDSPDCPLTRNEVAETLISFSYDQHTFTALNYVTVLPDGIYARLIRSNTYHFYYITNDCLIPLEHDPRIIS